MNITKFLHREGSFPAIRKTKRTVIYAAWLLGILVLLAANASAQSIPERSAPGRNDSASQAPLPTIKVWVNRSSRVYHCPGSRYYGATKRGEFISEAEARQAGNRPAYGRTCGPTKSKTESQVSDLRLLGSAKDGSDAGAADRSGRVDAMVWVNLKSHVYHCPGTRYYGATKRGQFMTEIEAREAGNRPAYGRSCR